MKTIKIGLETARRIALSRAAGFPAISLRGAEGVLAFLRGTGYVQIDTISVVERAHHHVLWTRVPGYGRGDVGTLESPPRRAFEYWTHAAAYLPLEDFRFCLPRMERVKRDGHDWFKSDEKTVRYVRERIAAEGPLSSKDFEGPRHGTGWWDWKPAKMALERLFHAGELLVTCRRNFQKVFDLAERVVPSGLDTRWPSDREMASYYVGKAVRSYGIFTEREIAYQRQEVTGKIPEELAEQAESGNLVNVEIEGLPLKYYATPASIKEASGKAKVPASPSSGCDGNAARVLSPFDPFIIDRKRIERLFGFSYALECYLPAAKRRFGYFALPILCGDRFVGLVDAKADRKARALIVKRLALFPDADGTPRPNKTAVKGLRDRVAAALVRFARFNGAEGLAFDEESGVPRDVRSSCSRSAEWD